MIGFLLGREYKLSVAEILTVFPQGKTVYFSNDFLILNNIEEDNVINNADKLWWTIKIIKIIDKDIIDIAKSYEWKFKYWISIYWNKKNLKEVLINTKKQLKKYEISSRFINKDFKNISSAQILWEKLVNKKTDFTYIYDNEKQYFWYTIWVQNIEKYSKRDYAKSRDMQVWMLPPKLCQIMINISWAKTIYDPFVWLWTILIESLLMWNNRVYWSDLNQKMVETSENNISNFAKNNSIELEDYKFIKLNSKFIHESEILKEKQVDWIVTEWYLWEIMTKKNISIDRINKQRQSLISIYESFFQNIWKTNYKWNIVISFPFWELNNKYIYFEEIYSIINKYCIIDKILAQDFDNLKTKEWSLLYKRDNQLVWREIFKLKIKEAS